MAGGSVLIQLGLDTKDFTKGLKLATRDFTQLGNELKKIGTSITYSVGAPIAGLAASAFAFSKDAQKAFKNFGESVKESLGDLGDDLAKTVNLEGILKTISGAVDGTTKSFSNLPAPVKGAIIAVAAIAAAIGPMILLAGQLTIALGAMNIALSGPFGIFIGLGVVAAALVGAAVSMGAMADSTSKATSAIENQIIALENRRKILNEDLEGQKTPGKWSTGLIQEQGGKVTPPGGNWESVLHKLNEVFSFKVHGQFAPTEPTGEALRKNIELSREQIKNDKEYEYQRKRLLEQEEAFDKAALKFSKSMADNAAMLQLTGNTTEYSSGKLRVFSEYYKELSGLNLVTPTAWLADLKTEITELADTAEREKISLKITNALTANDAALMASGDEVGFYSTKLKILTEAYTELSKAKLTTPVEELQKLGNQITAVSSKLDNARIKERLDLSDMKFQEDISAIGTKDIGATRQRTLQQRGSMVSERAQLTNRVGVAATSGMIGGGGTGGMMAGMMSARNLSAPIAQTDAAVKKLDKSIAHLSTPWAHFVGLMQKAPPIAEKIGNALFEMTQSFIQGVGDAVAGAIVFGTNLQEAMLGLLKNIAASIISTLIQLGIQWLITAIIGKAAAAIIGSAEVGVQCAIAAAAMFASVISALPFPANIAAAPGAAAGAGAGAAAAASVAGAEGNAVGLKIAAAAEGGIFTGQRPFIVAEVGKPEIALTQDNVRRFGLGTRENSSPTTIIVKLGERALLRHTAKSLPKFLVLQGAI